MDLRIEYYFDGEVRRWGFRVPALGINGSADTKAEAEQLAIQVVSEVLAGDTSDFDREAEAVMLHLEVVPA
ncbi:MAG TPA: hypothetical protein VIX82_01510 [Solirubrobacteraceae bacterium]